MSRRWQNTVLFFGIGLLAGCSRDALAPVDFRVSGEGAAFSSGGSSQQGWVVRPGDTLATMASRMGVSVQTLAEVNHLFPPYVLAEGQVLAHPAGSSGGSSSPGSSGGNSFAVLPPESDIRVASLAPSVTSPKVQGAAPAHVGRTLSERLQEVHLDEAPSGRILPTSKGVRAYSSGKSSTGGDLTAPSPAARKSSAAKKASEEEGKDLLSPSGKERSVDAECPEERTQKKGLLSWPVRGAVVSSFGQGDVPDGLLIKAAEGTKVRVADEGLVVYAGDKLKSYGNLVLVKHERGMMTAYAHLEKIAVTKGDYLERGQFVGSLGKTGDVSEAQLYFEVRKNKKPVNPLPYLRGKT